MTNIDNAPDAEKLIAWLREGAYELQNAHRVLDDAGVPRRNAEAEYTLAARIALLVPANKETAE